MTSITDLQKAKDMAMSLSDETLQVVERLPKREALATAWFAAVFGCFAVLFEHEIDKQKQKNESQT